jgi:CheY-like chemotaxis protein
LLNVVNDVLDFSRLDSGKQTLVMESFSVSRLVESAISVARAYPGADKLTLSVEVAPDVPPFLIGDRSALSRLLLNLLHNAVKFTAEGSVDLLVRMEPQPTGRPLVSFAVRDSGAGVPIAMQGKIFEPFEQASNGRLSPHHGTGLGLAICGRIATSMGGELSLRSQEGTGSIFICRLPLAAGAPVEEIVQEIKPSTRSVGERLRVLVAEDTPASQMVIRLMLEGLGHSVRLVGDGGQAVRAFREERFDLVFLDVQMPVMNGYEAARAIRASIEESRKARPAERTARLVGLSAFAQTADRRAALDAGMDDYLSKPIRAPDLSALMERLAFGPQTSVDKSAESPALGALDPDMMEEFLEVVGPAGFAEAIAAFERNTGEVVTRLSRLLVDEDDKGVKEVAHRLKGVFGQFGASNAAALAAEVEKTEPGLRAAAAARLLANAPLAIAMVAAHSQLLLKRQEKIA